MKLAIPPQALRTLTLATCLCGLVAPAIAQEREREPIAYIGHGAFFDGDGKEIVLTQEFVDKALAWYRQKLLADLEPARQKEFESFEKWLGEEFKVQGQARLVVRHAALEWLLASSKGAQKNDRLQGKLRALTYAMTWRLPERAGQKPAERKEPFKFDADLWKKLDSWRKGRGGLQVLSATINLGQNYINECAAAQVPIPPPINRMDPSGLTGWKSQGFIPISEQFIVQSPAEVRTFTTPDGMCIALPRYTDTSQTTVGLDGVICLSRITSKVCFWDNQMLGNTFSFPAATQIPIGVADPAVDPSLRYQAGGFELLDGAGGVCTDCHAGENPYIVHPNADLEPGAGLRLFGGLQDPPQSLPMFAPNRYDPLVPATWPQNQSSQTAATSPAVCVTCHVKGDAGRFPHLSSQLPGYCGTVLAQAITETMPPYDPGGEAGDSQVASFRSNWCNAGPVSSSEDTGDPHITTTNGVRYDFQAAGEFVALKNSDDGFELQTRQSPVLTGFNPGANAYTGLASCVSLNTAVALRVGRNRVTYQPVGGGFSSREALELRINGTLASASTVDLGGGNVIHRSTTDGELDIRLGDGTRVLVTPLFWSSQAYWYLDVAVFNTPAREGVMGHILAHDWLPRLPDGSTLGPRPADLIDRHKQLNQTFADAWRVTTTTSMFDYATGISTADFTDRNWPSEPGQACTTTSVRGSTPYVKEPRPDLAKKACSGIRNQAIRANCEFDVTVMGDAGAARGHRRADARHTN